MTHKPSAVARPPHAPWRDASYGFALLLCLGSTPACRAMEDANPVQVFRLGVVEVSAAPLAEPQGVPATRSREALDRLNRDTASAAVLTLPGVSMTKNARNEDMVFVRGFDLRQVPLFVDGVPVYVPYDGYVDFARFTLFDAAQVQVLKGGASVLLGPNTLGGAINLVTRRPVRAFEGDARIGGGSGGDWRAATNLGGNQGTWYYQFGASETGADTYPLSKDYTPSAAQGTGNRHNAARKDGRFSLTLGVTPNETDEFAIGFVRQNGEKGNPPYAGSLPGALRYWQWPYWDKQSLFFVGTVAATPVETLKMRVYHDTFDNSLLGFTDATYGKPLYNSSFPSYYNDATQGGSLELESRRWAGHTLGAALHFKNDTHLERNPTIADKKFADDTWSLAAEDRFGLSDGLSAVLGASWNTRRTQQADTFPVSTVSANNYVASLTQRIPTGEVFVSLARKSRFPTIKDRYSFRFGTAIPNPDLRPELATHFEAGYRGKPWAGAALTVSAFNSRIADLIQNVVVIAKPQTSQQQNIGAVRASGLEFALEQTVAPSLQAGATLSLLWRKNLSGGTPLLDAPQRRLFAYADWKFAPAWSGVLTLENEGGRWTAYQVNQPLWLSGYTSLGFKVVARPFAGTSFEAGVSNALDANYQLADGYPMPGRMFYANALYRF